MIPHPTASLKHSARILAAALLTALLIAPVAARAATVPATFEQLAASADAVVVARVAAVAYRQLAPDASGSRGPIVTDADLALERAIKGSRPAAFRLTVLGGEIGGLAMASSESPRLLPGRRVLLFLDAEGRIIGGIQGALEVAGADVPSAGLTLAQIEARITGASAALGMWSFGTAATPSGGLAAAAPVIAEITPDGQPSGTISVVTITGSGFGAARGFVRFPGPGYTLDAPISSWTDTQVVCVVPMDTTTGHPVAASSGFVHLATVLGTEATHYYRVGFAYARLKWDTGALPYAATLSVRYRLNESGAPAGALARAQAGAAMWNSVAASYFRFDVVGGGSETDAREHADGSNDIYWTATAGSPGVLAENRYWYNPVNGVIAESDIVFFPPLSQWGSGATDKYDVATVAGHELGHAIALLDQYGDPGDRGKLMFWQTSPGAIAHLSEDDASGLRFAYDPMYELPGPHLDVAPPAATPVGTAVTISTSATRVRYPRFFVLSGVLRPGYAGDPVVAEVRKPRSARWSYSSKRLCNSTAASGGANWWYRYTPKLRGTYYFRARYYGSAGRYGSLSRTISVTVR